MLCARRVVGGGWWTVGGGRWAVGGVVWVVVWGGVRGSVGRCVAVWGGVVYAVLVARVRQGGIAPRNVEKQKISNIKYQAQSTIR